MLGYLSPSFVVAAAVPAIALVVVHVSGVPVGVVGDGASSPAAS